MQPRICYIAYPTSLDLKAANAIQTYTTCRELKRLAPDTLVLVPKLPFQASAFERVGATHLLRLPINKASRFVRSTLWSYLERTVFALQAVFCLLLLRLLLGRRYDIVYVRDIICAFWLVTLLGKLSGVSVIYEVHDLEQRNPSRAKSSLLQPIIRFIDRRTLAGADAVVSLTAQFRDVLIQKRLQWPESVFVVPDAFDQEVYRTLDQRDCRDRLGLDQAAFVIAYSGLTFRYRSLDLLIAAFAEVAGQMPEAKLYLVGGRSGEIAELQSVAQRHNLAPDRVVFSGQVNQDKVLLFLNAADALTIPGTVTDVTASPLKMFEYMAVGKPIVSVDLPALREILDDESAVFFRMGDGEALTEALLRLATSPDKGEQLGKHAALKAQEHTYRRRAERILEVVKRATAWSDGGGLAR